MRNLASRLNQLSAEKRMLLEQRLSANGVRAHRSIQRRMPGEAAPLSFSQMRLWYLEQLNPGTATYNAPYAFRGHGSIDLEAFRKAVNMVIERHTVLRTAIAISETGQPSPYLANKWDAVEVVRMNMNGSSGEEEAQRFIADSAQRPFDISSEVMLRAIVIVLQPEDFIVLFTAHHIAWDGVSKGIFYTELGSFYDAITNGEDPPVIPLAVEYADYALWQQRSFTGATRDEEVAFWNAQLAGASPYLDIPLDKPRPAIQRFHGAKTPLTLPSQMIGAAQALSHIEKTTLYTTLLAAYKIFLLAFTSQEDISVSTPFAGRDEPETQNLIGFFTNTVVLRTRVEATASFHEIVKRVRESVLGAQEHQRMPMDQLMEILHPPRDLSRMPLAQVNFRLQVGKPPALRLRGLKLTPMPLIDTFISKFDMALEIASVEGEVGYLEYNTDLFDQARMNRIPAAFEVLLGELVASPNSPVGQLAAFQAIGQLRPKRRRIEFSASNSGARNKPNA